jgi:hypothetical protein
MTVLATASTNLLVSPVSRNRPAVAAAISTKGFWVFLYTEESHKISFKFQVANATFYCSFLDLNPPKLSSSAARLIDNGFPISTSAVKIKIPRPLNSHITADGRSVGRSLSMSWCRAPLRLMTRCL